jgi:phospholipid/cholesterol/gamma-HCH transport system ATP-binding protein
MQLRTAGARATLVADLLVQPGGFHLVYSNDAAVSTAVADALLGLKATIGGSVRYLDQAWEELDEGHAIGLRCSIGRVQSRGNWMETRPVMEGVLLPMRHCSILPDTRLREMAGELARRFGLPGLPMQLPNDCATSDLECAACVRAFLGFPTLVVLEHPHALADAPLLRPMIDEIQRLRRRQGAAIWFTEHASIAADPGVPASHRHRIVGGRLVGEAEG